MAILGWTTLAWQADYGQFYLIDSEDSDFEAPVDITPEMLEQQVFVPDTGLVVYTADSLQQHIRIAIHDAEPKHPETDWMSGKPWTNIQAVKTGFPSKSFGISSPSHPTPLPLGPLFFTPTETVSVRIAWMEFQEERDDSVPVEPDIIELTFWPA